MKLKLLAILVLLCAIIVTSTMGTFSSYSISLNYSGYISPDIEKIVSQLMPDYSALPQGVDILQSMEIRNHKWMRNDYSFMAFCGNIRQDRKNAAFEIGKINMDDTDFYIIYFEPGIKIFFYDGTEIEMNGFYKIKTAQDLFDNSLYLIGANQRILKNDNRLQVLNDPITACAELNIPLTLKN